MSAEKAFQATAKPPRTAQPDPARELELRRYQLDILSQATQDLVGLRDPEALLESFLLTTMGAVGAVMGFNAVLPPFSSTTEHDAATPKAGSACASLTPHLAARGLNQEQRRELVQSISSVVRTLPCSPENDTRPNAQIVIHHAPATGHAFPTQTSMVLGWKAASGRCGFFGLGQRLDETPYDDDTTRFLQNLLHLFIQALENACAARTIGSLNQELLRNNQALQQALHQARESSHALDRSVFRLRTLYDAAMELTPLTDSQQIMDTFALLLLGALGRESCWLLLHDTSKDSLLFAQRGLEKKSQLAANEAKKLLYACIQASAFNQLTPLNVQTLPPQTVQDQPSPIHTPSDVMLMRVDHDCLCLVLLGGRIAGSPQDSQDDQEVELLRSLGHNAMLFLRNARAFATIQALNESLQARNQELQKTLQELTASRSHIEVLERAGARLRNMLQHHASRLGRVSVWDFVWIILASVALGLFFNMNNPNGVQLLPESVTAAPAERVAPAAAAELLDNESDAVLVDARPQAFYEQQHAAGSLNMPPSLFDFIYSMRFSESETDPLFIIYGRTVSRLYDEEIARRLRSQGHGRILVLEGGLAGWEAAGGEVEGGE